MTIRIRKTIFWTTVIVFIVIVPIIVGYAQGWRFDFERGNFVQVGVIVLESNPKDAQILFGKDFIDKETPDIIKSLLPFRTYSVGVKKEGYQSWEKDLDVEPEKITSARNIFLFPNELNLELIIGDKKISLFSVSPNNKNIFIMDEAGQINIISLDQQRMVPVVFNNKTTKHSLNNIEWSEKENSVIFSRQINTQKSWFLFNISKTELINLTNLYEKDIILKTPSKNPLPYSFITQKIEFLNEDFLLGVIMENKLFVMNIEEKILEEINSNEDVKLFTFANENFFILNGKNNISEVDIKGNLINSWEITSFIPTNFLISHDNKKLAYFHNYAIGVMWLDDINEGNLKKAGEEELIFQSPKPINTIWWHHSSEYLLIKNGEFLTREIDNRGGNLNTASWSLNTIKDIEYIGKEKSLLVLKKDGTLWRHLEDF